MAKLKHYELFKGLIRLHILHHASKEEFYGSMFCFSENIESEAKKLFEQLKQDRYLQDLAVAEFARKAAHFLSDLNAIHAFREGNGRTQLSFFLLLADQAGHPISLERFDPDTFLEAMISSFEGDEAPLAAIITDLIEAPTG